MIIKALITSFAPPSFQLRQRSLDLLLSGKIISAETMEDAKKRQMASNAIRILSEMHIPPAKRKAASPRRSCRRWSCPRAG